MRQCIRILMIVLLLVVGIVPVAFARGSPGGFHGGGFGHGGFHHGFHHGFHGWHGGPFHHPHLHGGIIVETPPLWVAPDPFIGLTPEPPAIWYYCTDPSGYYPTVPTCRVPWTLYPQD
jgi:hypothetical protein